MPESPRRRVRGVWEAFPHGTPDVLRIQEELVDGTWSTIATEMADEPAPTDPWTSTQGVPEDVSDGWHDAEDRAAARLHIGRHQIDWQ